MFHVKHFNSRLFHVKQRVDFKNMTCYNKVRKFY